MRQEREVWRVRSGRSKRWNRCEVRAEGGVLGRWVQKEGGGEMKEYAGKEET